MSLRLREVLAINRSVTSSLEYDEVVRQVVERTAGWAGTDVCALVLADNEGVARVVAVEGADLGSLATFGVPLDEQVGEALRAAVGLPPGIAFLGVPIVWRQRVHGALLLYRTGRPFDEEQEQLVHALGDQAAIALAHARRYGLLEARAEHEAAQVDAVLELSATGLAYLDAELRFARVNAAYARLVGAGAEELVGRTHAEAGQGDLTPLLEHVLATGEPIDRTQLARAAPGHEAVPDQMAFWDWSVRRVEPGHGPRAGLVVSVVDVTELVAARRELEAVAHRKDEFLALLAHELRNPLGVLATGFELLARPGLDEERVERVRATGARQVTHVARLVDDLLDVARITHGKIALKSEVVDLRRAASWAGDACEAERARRRVELRTVVPDEPLWVHGDLDRLQQVFINLLTNAIKFSDEGGTVEFALSRADGPRGAVAEARVADQGVGIEPDQLGRVFEPFTQLRHRPGTGGGGLGIGLTLVRSLVELHGGESAAHSRGRGKGAVFTVRLPLCSQEGARSAPAGDTSEARVRRILVVEDQDDAAGLLASLLESQGHTVWVAHDGAGALRLAREHRPEVVLSDIGLPDMEGYELAMRLRAQAPSQVPRLVALTGFGSPDHRRRALEAGFDAHLVKPADGPRLRLAIEPEPGGGHGDGAAG